jgi:hypothetical protein
MYATRRRILGTMVVMFAAPRLAGCTGRESPKMTSTDSIELPGLTVRLSVERAEDGATLTYSAKATGQQTVFLLDGIHDMIGPDRVFPMRGAPWVTVSGGRVVASARFHGPPPGTFVNTLNYPFPTRIGAGETAQRKFAIPLPAVSVTPYQIFRRPPQPEIRALPLFFELGYFLGRPGVEQMARTVNTSEGPRPSFDALSEEGQMIARLGPLGEIPVVVNATEG